MQVEISDGSVRISTAFNNCPTVVLSAAPAVARAGGHVAVTVRASDDDVADHLSYLWTATAGAFDSTTGAAAVYTCPGSQQAGLETITISVSDGTCTEKRSVTVTCFAAADAGNLGGAGGHEGGGAGGAGGGPDAGDSEAGAGGTGGSAVTCTGDRTTCEGTLCNQCSFGVGPGESDLCATTANGCTNCIATTDGCSFLASDSLRTKCESLYVCMRDSGCVKQGDIFGCWCGTTDVSNCTVGAIPANGPCLQQINEAAGSTDPAVINLKLSDPTSAVAGAGNLAACRSNFCSGSADLVNPAACPLWQ